MHVSAASAYGGQRQQIPLEPKLQAVVSHPVMVLGIKVGSSVQTVHALNCWDISSGSIPFSFMAQNNPIVHMYHSWECMLA